MVVRQILNRKSVASKGWQENSQNLEYDSCCSRHTSERKEKNLRCTYKIKLRKRRRLVTSSSGCLAFRFRFYYSSSCFAVLLNLGGMFVPAWSFFDRV